ncbi:uncharacterized protein I303_104363 [Kwoniella dejecticola CBS 10117]|uniref:Spindle pole body component n=1 Tax=Kwoniella dejecticola CBS 10117 TaxID=1296121 RepID=A0A1A6A5J2_9TREE|nr:gamma-tubulin complex component 2 [Kwoniella dejecticola CBS 10117]OBR85326.1 gamma-tubulin complex component 2 [Kwoniella dejecticola CBS 10117]
MSARVPSGSTVPFTPKPRKRSSSSRLSLNDREYNQFVGTLASVRRVKPNAILEELEQSGEGSALLARADGPTKERSGDRNREALHSRPSTSRADRIPSASSQQPRPSSSSSRFREKETSRPSSSRSTPIASAASVRPEVDNAKKNGKLPERVAQLSLADGPDETEEGRSLDGIPLEMQEAWICEDLLFVLQGVEGSLIRYADDYDPLDGEQASKGARWRVDPSLDPSLLSLVERLLPLATCFTAVETSMDSRNAPEYGMVSHALTSGIRAMLKEYRVLAAQLESLFLSSPTFTLQTLYFHLHPTLHTMSLLAGLCLALETDEAIQDASDASDDDDGLGGMAEELGLGGAGLKGLMKNLNAQEGLIGGGGPVLGGEVLGIICEREATMSGDPTASTLHSTLLLHASQPYFRMLVRWISTGSLSDPFDEFMVKESGHITKGVLESDYTDEYWERRYTLRDGSSLTSSKVGAGKSTPTIGAGVAVARAGTNRLPGGACIPGFLQPWKHKILLAGKYLNVIRECGIEVKKPNEVQDEEGDGMVVLNEPRFYKRIEDAYIYANKTLLKLMVEEQELIPHLRSMKHFFFLDQSDFLTNFLDLAGSELRKPAKAASLVKLQSLLDLAVRNPASSSSNDPYKDDLKVVMQSQKLYDWLLKIVSKTGGLTEDGELDFAMGDGVDHDAQRSDKDKTLYAIDALAFDYSVKFPLSLVISRKTITRYQLIFRFLLHLHHLESALSSMWMEQKTTAWRINTQDPDMEKWKYRVFSLRSRMLDFVRQVLAFATGEVLEPNWKILEGKLGRVQTVDQLLKDHVDFLDTCLKQCMLTTSKLLSIYARLMRTISTFISYQSQLNIVINRFMADPEGESNPKQVAARWSHLQKFEAHFNHNTKLHLDAVTYNAGSENVALLALVTRLHQTTLRI